MLLKTRSRLDGKYHNQIHMFMIITERFERTGQLMNMSTVTHSLAKHVLPEGHELVDYDYKCRSFRSHAHCHHIPWHSRMDPNTAYAELDKAQNERAKAEAHMEALYHTIFGTQMQNIVQKLVHLENRAQFLAQIQSMCNSGTDDWLKAYPSPGSMEHLFNLCKQIGNPPIHQIRMITSQQHQNFLAQDRDLTKAVERLEYLEGVLRDHSIPFNPPRG